MARLNYVTVGTNQIAEACAFYDALLGSINVGKLFDDPSGSRLYGGFDDWVFGVMVPHDQHSASTGNGTMCAFALDSRDAVAAFHALALELGGSDEGAPGLRGPEEANAYFAYFRDLDDNKLCAYYFG